MKPRKKKPDNSTFSNILEKDKLDEMRLRKVEEKQQRQDLKRKQKAEMKNNENDSGESFTLDEPEYLCCQHFRHFREGRI